VEDQLKGKYILEAFLENVIRKKGPSGEKDSMKKSKHEVSGSFRTGKFHRRSKIFEDSVVCHFRVSFTCREALVCKDRKGYQTIRTTPSRHHYLARLVNIRFHSLAYSDDRNASSLSFLQISSSESITTPPI
jgi:hypothetical protein